MPATGTARHLLNNGERRLVEYDLDDALNIVDLGQPQGAGEKCLPIAHWRRFAAGLFRSVGTGSVDAFQIIAATAADGTGATIVKAHALGSAPDAIGDTIWLETTVGQVREVLPTATHVGLRVQLATATDECVFYFERAEAFYSDLDKTNDYIAA